MRTILVWLGLCCLPPVSAFAQKDLHWDTLAVAAHLNADGTLNVVETHTMVFTGEWNGGERTFNIRPHQRLSFTGIYRGGPGGWRALTEDPSLDDVDEFSWADPHTLRWRSRRASDPPFDETAIGYEIRYVLSNILLKEEDRYRLDHDFAFPDRPGPINRFELRLTLDPAWQPMAEVQPLYTAGPLAPRASFVRNLSFGYTGTETPAALDLTRRPSEIVSVSVLLGLTMVALIRFFVREEDLGRFDPLERQVDEPWIREHVLKYPAEVVAAAWDESIGTAEVVALIARMVVEGKLESVVGTGKGASASMTLRLRVDRRSLEGHERTLVDKLFFDSRVETSTSAVRTYYRKKGFNPVNEIQKGLEAAVKSMLPAGRAPRRFKLIGLALFVAGVGVLAVMWHQGYPGAFPLVLAMVVLTGIGAITGRQFRCYLAWGYLAALLCLIPALTIAIGVALYLWFYAGPGAIGHDPYTILGIVTVALACIHSSINALKSRQSAEAIAFRKTLTAGRSFFAAELRKAQPALRDEWYPWLLGMELSKHVDAWSTAHASTGKSSGHGSFGSVSSASSSGPAEWTGFGGGRSGGAGASASWQAAASGLAATVTPPSSSGSGGSSSGSRSSSSSSGGGGGGGW